MRFLSVCSGIEAASVAWHPLGWEAAGFAEIEPFPCAVLAARWPGVRNLGDMTGYEQWDVRGPVDVVCGGTPCQGFSLAGLRGGLADPRGQLTLAFLGLAGRFRPRWVVWENVPGVLSDRTNAFGQFLGGLAELGYGWAYRVLDAQYFGVPQQRRRVFVVGCLGGWAAAAAVLFERESLLGNPPPGREAGQGAGTDVAPSLTASGRGFERTGESRGQDPVIVCQSVTSKWAKGTGGPAGDECQNLVPVIGSGAGGGFHGLETAHTLRASHDASEDGTGRGTPLVPALVSNGDAHSGFRDEAGLVACRPYVLAERGREGGRLLEVREDGIMNALLTPSAGRGGMGVGAVSYGLQVRRLTPRECERLQGFPDDYTLVAVNSRPRREQDHAETVAYLMAAGFPAAEAEALADHPDGPRYKALGNSWAVPVARWIGQRLAKVDGLLGKVSK